MGISQAQMMSQPLLLLYTVQDQGVPFYSSQQTEYSPSHGTAISSWAFFGPFVNSAS